VCMGLAVVGFMMITTWKVIGPTPEKGEDKRVT
jgi:hypothetical protein